MNLFRSYLLLLLLVLPAASRASHILGGEIRYEHLTGNQYKFEVDVYRDCGSCKLNGNGKGSSQENCDDIKLLYITHAGEQGGSLASIQISRQSITDITPVCNLTYNNCENSSGLFGIERHRFTGTYDFSALVTEDQCNFDIHLQIASRSTALTNGMDAEKFHNYTRLNLCLSESNQSPGFLFAPVFNLENGKIYRLSSMANDADGDSLSYHLVLPMVDFDLEGQYASGFNQKFPLSTYCPLGGQCQPFPDLERPIGFHLNPLNGQLSFIPTKASEVSVMCIEVREYRKINGIYAEIGRIRRDVQLNVIQASDNNAPEITQSDDYFIKAQEKFCMDINFSDASSTRGQANIEDTVRLKYVFNGGQHEWTTTETDSAPFREYSFCFTPKWTDTLKVFNLWLEANDGYCPLPLKAQKSVSLRVLPPQRAEILVSQRPCNLYQFAYHSNLEVKHARWQVFAEDDQLLFEKRSHRDSFYFSEAGQYKILLLLDAGAGADTFEYALEVTTSQQSLVSIDAARELCTGDSLILRLTAQNGYRVNANRWYLNGQELRLNGQYSDPIFESGTLRVVSTIEQNGFYCTTSDTQHVSVLPLPDASFIMRDKFCEGRTPLVLQDLEVALNGGTWSHEPSENLQADELRFPSGQQKGQLTYTVRGENGCFASSKKEYDILSGPEFSLNDLDICQTKGWLSVRGLTNRTAVNDSEIVWDFGSLTPFVSDFNGTRAISLDSMNSGFYVVTGMLHGNNGCTTTDTSTIAVRDELSITFGQSEINICDTLHRYDLEALTRVSPHGGMFVSDDWRDELIDNTIKAGSCGSRTLTYTYDQFGCFGSQEIVVNVVCEPEIEMDIPSDMLCDGFDGMQLNPVPAGGQWHGSIVNNQGVLNISPLTEPETVSLTYEIELNQCRYSKTEQVLIFPSPILNYHLADVTFCEGDEFLLHTSGQFANALHIKTLSGKYDTSIALPGGDLPFDLDLNFKLDQPPASSTEMFVIHAEALSDCPTEYINLPLTIYPTPRISYSTDEFSGCAPYEMNFAPKLLNYDEDKAIYQWDFDDEGLERRSESIQISHVYERPGTYLPKLIINTLNGCTDTFIYAQGVRVYMTPEARFTTEPEFYTSISEPVFRFINQSSKVDSIEFHWDFGTMGSEDQSQQKDPWFSYPKDTSRYTVRLTVTGAGGCTDQYEREIMVGPDIQLFIPNAFSPNKKGPPENNVFMVQGQNVSEIVIRIYDRWGHQVFQAKDLSESWDGTSNGNLCTQGVYTYHINVMSKTGVQYEYAGTVHLLR